MSDQTNGQAIVTAPPEVNPSALVPADQESPQGYQQLLKDEDFVAFLNRIANYAKAKANSAEMWERRRKTVQMRKYITGEYYGIYDQSRGWVSGDAQGDNVYFDPQAATFLDDLVSNLVKSKPQIQVRARDEQRIDKKEAAKVFEKLVAMDQDQDFTPKKQQREWKWNLLAGGDTFRITFFNSGKPGRGFLKNVYQSVQIKGGDKAVYCPLCNSTDADESGESCANCGNPQMDVMESLGSTIQQYMGQQYCQIGDCDYDVPDCLEMCVIGDTDAVGEALIVYRFRHIPRCVLQDALDMYDLPDTERAEALSYKQMFGDDSAGFGSDNKEFQPLLYEELWVAPAVYSGRKFNKDTQTESGETYKQGTSYKQAFPSGVYYSRVQKRITQFYPQCAGDCVSHAANAIGEGFHGQGEWDVIDQQDQATELRSLKMNSAMEDSTMPMIVRSGVIDAEAFENKPGLVIEASQDFPGDASLDQIMTRVKPGQLSREVWELNEEVKGTMQHRIGAFSTQTDDTDIRAMGTATGVATLQQKSLGRRGPQLMLYSQMFVDQAYQTGEMRRKYWPKKMYDSIAKDLGSDAVKWFMESNIKNDFIVTVLDGSWMPQTDAMKRAGFESYASIAGKILAARGDSKGMDELLQKASEIYNAGIDFADVEAQSIEAQLRLDKLKDVCAFVEQQFGPMLINQLTGQIDEDALKFAYQQTAQVLRIGHVQTDQADIFAELPLDPMFDTHTEFEDAYTDWLRTAEGRSASAFTRLAVRQLADYHLQAESYKVMKIKEYANITQIPDLEAAQVASDAQNQQDLAHSAHQTEQNLLYQGVQAAGEQAVTGMPQPAPPKVIETINYKDLPPSVQRQVEQAAGFTPAGEPETSAQIASMQPKPQTTTQPQNGQPTQTS